jgi:hypothetical protein
MAEIALIGVHPCQSVVLKSNAQKLVRTAAVPISYWFTLPLSESH